MIIGSGQITGIIAAVIIVGIMVGLYVLTQKPQIKRKIKNKKSEQEVWYERKKDFIPKRYHVPIEVLLKFSKHVTLRQKVLNMALVAEGFENKHTKGTDNPFEKMLEIMQRRVDLDVDEAFDTKSFEVLDKPYVVELLILKREAFIIGKHNDNVYVVKDLKNNVFNVSAEEVQLPSRFKGKKPSRTSNYIPLKTQKVKKKDSDKELTLLGATPDEKLIVKNAQNQRETHAKNELTTKSGKTVPMTPELSTHKYYLRLLEALRNRSLIADQAGEEIKALLKP